MNIEIIEGRKNRCRKSAFKAALKSGKFPIRFFGDSDSGYRVAAQINKIQAVAFGFQFARQSHVVNHCEQKYGRKPSKIVDAVLVP